MGIARSEIRHMIEHMAKLMVQEADSWANTYGPEAGGTGGPRDHGESPAERCAVCHGG